MRYFARSGALIGFADKVRAYGESPERLLRHVGLSVGMLKDVDLYMPYESLAEVLNLAAERCGDSMFGAQLGWQQGLEAVGALGSLMCLQTNLPDALTLLQRHLDFHARGVQIDVGIDGGLIEIRMDFDFSHAVDCSQLSALSMALFLRSMEQLIPSACRATRLQLAVSSSDSAAAYSQLLGVPVTLNGAENVLYFPLDLLEMPIEPAQQTRERLSRQWRHAFLGEPVGLPQQVESAMVALLPTGECNLNTVSKLLGLHPRSLQNYLKKDRTSFGEIQKTTRLKLALQYLRNTNTDLTTLAMNLGFSELAPFSRCFKQWTGQSPRAWRRTHRQGPVEHH